MDVSSLNPIGQAAIQTLVSIVTPILLIALVVGVCMSFLQALTHIQEGALTFIPKMLSVFIGLIIMAPYILKKLTILTDHIVHAIITK
ncbi:flagellar biosynthetic protein FliQ [Candidatus Sneabacter namystus]|uniref:Flagellar biosynthetic protein FliQ n=1 Tax=Candidatus Sneabacter namystus TaxID=2601646 RepID=A0A5C0ULG6_9RICK|nr:flagellar biosynthetic protein FliQ [Candidatus Sneabacter namystus]QEK39724.1 hypothetical protein FZC37_02170 [Candidatus Sneabacter namystus]